MLWNAGRSTCGNKKGSDRVWFRPLDFGEAKMSGALPIFCAVH